MRKTILAAFAALLVSGGNAGAEGFPSHPLTMVVPFSAGGPTDAMARILAERMRVTLGQNILIENVIGARGLKPCDRHDQDGREPANSRITS